MSGKSFSTPLRYPGGKGKFAHFVKDIFEENNLLDGHYVEPYAGGAGVALELLFHEYASTIHINDFDPAVYAFWYCSVHETDQLIQSINDVSVTIEEWHRQKSILKDSTNHSLLEVALATFFLNRTNRSGILKAGVIGGKSQSGKWKLDARFNKENLIKRIDMIGRFRNRIKVYNLDAVELLETLTPSLPERSLIYLDPPYYVKGSGLYRNFYEHDDHVKIKETLDSVNKNWIVSYDNVDQIKEMYKNYRQDDYFLSYTAQSKKKGAEVMIYGPTIRTPKLTLPSIAC